MIYKQTYFKNMIYFEIKAMPKLYLRLNSLNNKVARRELIFIGKLISLIVIIKYA